MADINAIDNYNFAKPGPAPSTFPTKYPNLKTIPSFVSSSLYHCTSSSAANFSVTSHILAFL